MMKIDIQLFYMYEVVVIDVSMNQIQIEVIYSNQNFSVTQYQNLLHGVYGQQFGRIESNLFY